MPVFARGHARFSHSGNGHCGHLPVENFRATGIAGIGFLANGRAKAGTGMPVGNTSHYAFKSYTWDDVYSAMIVYN